MGPPSLDAASAAADLQLSPAIGPFFEQHYGAYLQVSKTGRQRSQSLAEFPARTRERLLAQATAHWLYPTFTHYAAHELRLLHACLPRYGVGLHQQFDVHSADVLQVIKEILLRVLGGERSTGSAPGDQLDLSRIDCKSPELLELLTRPLRDQLIAPVNPLKQRSANCVISTWLASIPQLLRGQLYPTPQGAAGSMQADIAGTLRNLPQHLLRLLLPNSLYQGAVCYQPPAPNETEWHMVTAVLEWRDCLIIVDTDFNVDYALAQCKDFHQYIDLLQETLRRPAPCSQFRQYLESAPEVALYRQEGGLNYCEYTRVRVGNYRQIVHLAVSMDDMLAHVRRASHFSAQSQSYGVLALSIHELMCYRDLLKEPTVLMYFLEQRVRALGNPHLEWLSELDHICIQQREPNYPQRISAATEVRKLVQHPYRLEIEHCLQRKLYSELHMKPPGSPSSERSSTGPRSENR